MKQSHGHPNSAKNIALLLYVRALGIFCYSSIIESKLTTIADISEKLACNSKPPVVQTLVGGRQVEGKYIFWEDPRTMEDLHIHSQWRLGVAKFPEILCLLKHTSIKDIYMEYLKCLYHSLVVAPDFPASSHAQMICMCMCYEAIQKYLKELDMKAVGIEDDKKAAMAKM